MERIYIITQEKEIFIYNDPLNNKITGLRKTGWNEVNYQFSEGNKEVDLVKEFGSSAIYIMNIENIKDSTDYAILIASIKNKFKYYLY